MKRFLLSALVVLAGSASLAGSAQAAVIDHDPAQILAAKFDFGDNTFVAGAPMGSGDVEWNYTGGDVSPELTGTLHLRNAFGECGRMRLEQFDAAGNSLITTVGGMVCPPNNAHHAYAVNLNPGGDPLTHHATVSVERLPAAGGWATVGSVTATADTQADAVQITAGAGAGFGGSGWLFGAPVGSGSVSWNLENGTLKPHLQGTVHLDSNAGQCVRMNLSYLTEFGAFITSMPGGMVCAPNNAHHAWSVNLAPYRDVIGQVDVELQTLGAAGWVTIGAQNVSVAL